MNIDNWKSIFSTIENELTKGGILRAVKSRLLNAIKINTNSTGSDILKIIKEKLKQNDESTYEKWKNKGFDTDYTFYVDNRVEWRGGEDHYKSFGFTLLHFAAYYGCKDVVGLLLSKKADIEGLDKAGHCNEDIRRENLRIPEGRFANLLIPAPRTHSPLHLAAQSGHTEIVKALMEKGADFHALDQSSRTPLHLATQGGHVSVANALIEKGADVHALNESSLGNRYNSIPLHLAAEGGHLEIVKYLIDKKNVDPDLRDNAGVTPLLLAAERGHLEIAEYLGTKKSASTSLKDTPPQLPPRSENVFSQVYILFCGFGESK